MRRNDEDRLAVRVGNLRANPPPRLFIPAAAESRDKGAAGSQESM